MASLFPNRTENEPEQEPGGPPADLLAQARQNALQELQAFQQKPQQPSKNTLLTGQRRFV